MVPELSRVPKLLKPAPLVFDIVMMPVAELVTVPELRMPEAVLEL